MSPKDFKKRHVRTAPWGRIMGVGWECCVFGTGLISSPPPPKSTFWEGPSQKSGDKNEKRNGIKWNFKGQKKFSEFLRFWAPSGRRSQGTKIEWEAWNFKSWLEIYKNGPLSSVKKCQTRATKVVWTKKIFKNIQIFLPIVMPSRHFFLTLINSWMSEKIPIFPSQIHWSIPSPVHWSWLFCYIISLSHGGISH